MSFAAPRTPTATPRKALQTTRPSSRLSNHPSTPSGSSSSNNALPRPLSRTGLADAVRPSSRASQISLDGRQSPTKRTRGDVAFSGGGAAGRPSSSSTIPKKGTSSVSLASNGTSRLSSRLERGGDEVSRTSDASTAVFGSSTSLVSQGEEDIPRRRAGFGSLSGPGASLDGLASDGEEREGSIVEGRRGPVTPHQAGEVESDEDETETEEEEKDGKQQNVVVCLRVRPSKSSSQPQPHPPQIYSLSPAASTLTLTPAHPTLAKRGGHTSRSDEYEFRFDMLHVAPSPTVELYDGKIRPVVRAALGGFNGTVFAYGQTASGKTHTMMGSPEEPGVIPLAIDELFSYIHKQNTHRTYSLRVSFLEIYNEQLRDLLASSTQATTSSNSSNAINPSKPPEIVGSGRVENLTERAVSLPNEVLDVLKEGDMRRRVGATDWNERSSRSHCVFVVTIESMSKKGGEARTSQLNLIDLAGSESATGQSDRLAEGKFINRSLLTLGTVIAKLTEPSPTGSTAHIPYRDSKLTRLLQPALSGNSRVAVVCTVSPDAEQASETLSTLKFARRAKMVVTKAERGVLMTDQILLKRYAAQVDELQAQIKAVETGEALKERERAEKRAEEAEKRGKEAEDALASTTAELARLRAELAKTQSLILTGPSLEVSARRASLNQSQQDLPALLSPSRTFSGSGLRGMGSLGGGRCVSDMSALGLGTPLSLRTVREKSRVGSAGARLAEEDEAREKELTLIRDLESARAEVSSLTASAASTTEELSTLRTQLSQLQRSTSLARLDAEKTAAAAEDRKARVRQLESDAAELKERLNETERDRDEAREEVERLKVEIERLRGEAEQARAEASATAMARDEELQKKGALLSDLEATVASLEQRLVAQHDAAGDASAALAKERDLALTAATESAQRFKEVEELSALAAQTASAAEVQLRREHATDLSRLQDDLVREKAQVESLSRQVERLEGLEKQRTTWRENQRAGTEALKSRLADLQARSSSSSINLARCSSSASASSAASERSRASSATGEGQAVLEARNAELIAKVQELEREREERTQREEKPMDVREKLELVGEKERERKRAEVAEGMAEGWKQKYLAVQKLLDQLTASGPAPSNENHPLQQREGSATPRKPSPALRGPLGIAQTPSSRPSMPHSPQASFSSNSSASTWNKPTPPPLPYSPQQQSREARSARKARRETIAKDLARLKGSRVVGERREGWDSPVAAGGGTPPTSASPTKASFGLGAQWESRERKGSWEM
ncbi:hypothetical protein JCM11251_005717 [Rhodosporidiobolus azoricus]